MAKPTKSVALLILFEGFNTLDVNGPLEVLRKSGMSEVFQVEIASETPTTTSAEGAIMQRHIPLDQDLIENRLANYDLLIVPGGNARGEDSPIQKLANDPSRAFNQVIKAFSNLHSRSDSPPRILLSICTGAIFLAKLGIFNGGRFCTTHWQFYDVLVSFNKAAALAAGPDVKAGVVIPSRYVDSGINKNQITIISSGGISSGMDAALHVVELRAGEAEARDTAEILDYSWRKTVGVQFNKFD